DAVGKERHGSDRNCHRELNTEISEIQGCNEQNNFAQFVHRSIRVSTLCRSMPFLLRQACAGRKLQEFLMAATRGCAWPTLLLTIFLIRTMQAVGCQVPQDIPCFLTHAQPGA